MRRVPTAPPASSAGVRSVMQGNRRSNTRPEMAVRRVLYANGFRYRLHAKDLPGKPDIVFRSRKVAIFVHGCFWHQHQDPRCPLRKKPKSNTSYWNAKLERNVERDIETRRALDSMGWRVLVVWECQASDEKLLVDELNTALEACDRHKTVR